MDVTARLKLPLLAVAQAAKEMTVNEALTVLEIAVQSVVEAEVAAPPASPDAGQCWLVAAGATGGFAGHDGAIAGWTDGGWRFVEAVPGMTVWRLDEARLLRRGPTIWSGGGAVTPPAGGTTIDVEARAAILEIRARLRDWGLIAA